MTFKIGDQVWIPVCGNQQVQVECPVCFGRLKVTLILGNGDELILPCDYCAKGHIEPRGKVMVYEYVSNAELQTIDLITETKTEKGSDVQYQNGCQIFHKVFATKEEALAECENIRLRLEEEQNTRADYLKKDAHKSFSWNAGYHMREVKNHEKQAEYHRRLAVLCKARAKTGDDK